MRSRWTGIFLITALVFFLTSAAMAVVLPADEALESTLKALDPTAVEALHRGGQAILPSGLWRYLVVPVLMRPAWLLPACIGIVAIGLAMTSGRRADKAG
jgi:hypothetical protein